MNTLQSLGGASSALSAYTAGATPAAGGIDVNSLMQQASQSGGQQGDDAQISDEAQEENGNPQEMMKQRLESAIKEIDHKIHDLQARINRANESAEEGGESAHGKRLQHQMDDLQKQRGELGEQLTKLTGGDEGGGDEGGGGGGLGDLVGKAAGGVGHIISGLFD